MDGRTFVRYVAARVMDKAKREAYEAYIAECLRLTTENTARAHGGSVMRHSWHDLINKPRAIDGRTGGEIAADVIARAGLEVS